MALNKKILTLVLLALPLLMQSQVGKDNELHQKILNLDKMLFDAYNACDLKTQDELMDEDLEFYHDMAGLSTSKSDVLKSIEDNICGKVTRTLVEGSVEVHEIKGFGAVEIGLHKFYNNQEPNAESKPSKFIAIWKNKDSVWTITRVISLHNN